MAARWITTTLCLTCGAVLLLAAGCASLDADRADRTSLFGMPKRDEQLEEDEGWSWSDLHVDNLGTTAKKLTGRGPNKEAAKQLYREADDLYRQAMRAEPDKKAHLFSLAAPKFAEAAERWPKSALAMDGYFMAGEAYFFADQYPKANLEYEKLIKEFPNNRFLDIVDQRRFALAKYWLDANRDSPEGMFYANFWNKTRPWRDARGHGLRVYDKIRIDDPTGRLADDATLAAANEHFGKGKYVKADEYYTDLRSAYPTSEHQFTAHFLGLKAKLLSYQGPAYGGTVLDEAEKLIKQMRRQFPQESEKEREYLDRSAAEIRYRMAERLSFLAEFHDKRNEYRAAEHYYAQVVQKFRDTPLAARAEERVGQIAGLPPVPAQQLPWLVALFPESDKVKPLLAATQRAREQEAVELAEAEQAAGGTVQR
jgi:outer membrane protein assembly factor BamD (BamD/ComL family)